MSEESGNHDQTMLQRVEEIFTSLLQSVSRPLIGDNDPEKPYRNVLEIEIDHLAWKAFFLPSNGLELDVWDDEHGPKPVFSIRREESGCIADAIETYLTRVYEGLRTFLDKLVESYEALRSVCEPLQAALTTT